MDETVPNQGTQFTSPIRSLESLLSDPERLKHIATLLQSEKSLTSEVNTHEQKETKKSESSSTDMLSGLLKDPAFMEKLPSMMAMLKPLLQSTSLPAPSSESHGRQEKEQKKEYDSKEELLLALKPFLSPSRCEAVDTILRLSKLGTILKHLH